MRSRWMVTVLASSSLAFAQTRDSARAERLFDDAKALMERGNFAAACPKLEESQLLDPALGTQFNLALCYEKTGFLASAWRNYKEVEKLAHATGKTSREESVRTKLAALRPLVGHLVITSVEPDVTVRVDGTRVEPDDWSFFPVNPGEHVIDATASAKRPWQTKVDTTAAPGAEVDVAIPKLEIATQTKVKIALVETSNTQRTAGLVIGGVGVVGLVGAAITGLVVLDAKSTASAHCTPTCLDDTGRNAVSTGKTLLVLNGVAWGVAALGLGLGFTLFLTAPKKQEHVGAFLTPTGALLRGVF